MVGKLVFVGWLFILSFYILPAQVTVVEGSLSDLHTGEPIPYASVTVVGNSSGTTSNADGTFTLKIPAQLSIRKFSIKISCVGYENYIVENPSGFLALKLEPAKTLLKEVVVFGKDISAEGIVQKAFANIKKNYYSKPFVYKTFYRHYCKDDSVYGRLIEAAADIYKRKGYRSPQPNPGFKDEVRVNQLRRTFDNTKFNSNHVPIALYSAMAGDFAGYQSIARSSSDEWVASMGVDGPSALRKYIKLFTFDVRGITEFDDEEVYEISYRLPKDTILVSGLLYPIHFEGTLYINTRNYAFVKTESIRETTTDTLRVSAFYRKNKDKYFLYHTIRDGKSLMPILNFRHNFHIEMMTTDIVTRNYPRFKGKEPGKESLFGITYDSVFWSNYNILKATPLEEHIVSDLERRAPLSDQFQDYVEVERERFFSGKEDEERFNRFLKINKGRVIYIDFWASWCGPCIKEMPSSRKLVEKYKSKIAFAYVSLDDDINSWKEAVKKHKLVSPYAVHFRVGSKSDAQKLFDIAEIPRYVLVDRNGNFVDQDARRPSDLELEKDIMQLLTEKIDQP